MIRATGAKFRMLASEPPSCFLDLEARGVSEEREEARDMIGRVVAGDT